MTYSKTALGINIALMHILFIGTAKPLRMQKYILGFPLFCCIKESLSSLDVAVSHCLWRNAAPTFSEFPVKKGEGTKSVLMELLEQL